MDKLVSKWKEYEEYIKLNKFGEDRYLNFNDFMQWLESGFVW